MRATGYHEPRAGECRSSASTPGKMDSVTLHLGRVGWGGMGRGRGGEVRWVGQKVKLSVSLAEAQQQSGARSATPTPQVAPSQEGERIGQRQRPDASQHRSGCGSAAARLLLLRRRLEQRCRLDLPWQ